MSQMFDVLLYGRAQNPASCEASVEPQVEPGIVAYMLGRDDKSIKGG